jgi:hypothetical protein
MKYKQCKVEYTDEPNNFEIKATSFYIVSREKRKGEYNRAKIERKLEREER